MLRYVVHRVLVMIPTLIVISVLVFTIIQLPPGDYLTTMVNELQAQGENVNQERVAYLREQYGLDRSVVEQYVYWVWGMLHGDMGHSFEHDKPVNEVVGDRMYLTMLVAFVTTLFVYVMSFPIGVYSAVRQYSIGDFTLSFIGFIGLATPIFCWR